MSTTSAPGPHLVAEGHSDRRKEKLPAQLQETGNAETQLFSFSTLPSEGQEMDLESLTWSSWSGRLPLPLRAHARPSSPPSNPGAPGREADVRGPRTMDPTPELRVPGRPGRPSPPPPQAVPPTRSLRLPRPSRELGRQFHLLPKAQTPAPANTRSERSRPRQPPPCWRRRVSRSP